MQQETKPYASKVELDVIGVISGLARQKRPIITVTVISALLALSVSYIQQPVYTATSTILPPQQQSNGLAAALGSLGVLAGAAGGISGIKNPNDLYVAMLKSQSVADGLIKKLNLQKRFGTATIEKTRAVLRDSSNVSAEKDGLIVINVDSHDPNFAAQLANAYVEELKNLNQRLAVTDASKRRLFFETQLEKVKKDLNVAEAELKKVQQVTGLIAPEGQVAAVIAGVAELKAQIASKEVQLASMASMLTETNPDYQRTRQEIFLMRQQLQKLEHRENQSSLSLGAGDLPESGLTYLRALRAVKYQEAMFELLSKQHEIAKIEEAKDSSLIQVLDEAKPPENKTRPKRFQMLLMGVIIGFAAGVLLALIKEQIRIARLKGTGRWAEVAAAWRSGN